MQTCRRSAQNGLSCWTITGVNGTEIVVVDERDSSWEFDEPRFRVHLQEASGSSVGRRTATYDIVGADVVQVIDWVVPPADRMPPDVAESR